MAPRLPARTEKAKRALALLRSAATRAQRQSGAADAEMAEVLDSLHITYARRAHTAAITAGQAQEAAR